MKNKKKIIVGLGTMASLLALTTQAALAHVSVTPTEVVTAARQDFSVGVPNEKEVPTTQVRLVIPEGLESVTPYVKPGWKIDTKKTGEGEDAMVTEITWSGGEIGAGLRDAFVFRATTPADEKTLVWKAYQTYEDGTVVSWDQQPTEEEVESETTGPYSETKVVKELATSSDDSDSQTTLEKYTTWAAYGALLLSVVAIALILRKKTA